MPFLKEFIINDKTNIKLWKVMIGELSPKELNNDEKKLFKLKKSNVLKEQFLATRKILELENSISLKEPPSRQVSKLCHFCKYESECNPFTEEIVEIPNLLKNSTIRRNDHV